MKFMQRSKGAMSAGAMVAIGIVAAIVVGFFLAYVSAYNNANRLEQTIKAEAKNNENILATYGQKVQEAAQVPGMMRDDIVAIAKAAIGGRYGENGSQAAVQMIREQNPQVDSSLYKKLQQIIEAGRDEFKTHQTRLIDAKRVYETELGSFFTGSMMHFAGYPKINLDDYKVVSTGRAQDAFRTGREDSPIQLRPGAQ
jgi:hypothetical protein